MISSKTPNELPNPPKLRELCQSVALLEEIMQPDPSSRTYTYDVRWAEGEELASLRSGEGDSAFVWFTQAGVILRGFDPQCAVAKAKKRPPIDELFEGAPAALAAVRSEPAFGGEDQITFAIWRASTDDAWQVGKRARGDDGSAKLLFILEAHPLNFIQYATRHFERKLPMEVVQPFYQRRTVTAERIRALRADADVESVLSSAAAMGFPTTASPAAAQKPLGASTIAARPPPGPLDVSGDAEMLVVRDGRRTKLVIGGRVHAWGDDADAFERIRDYARGQLPFKR